jgi:hypothetical protein
MYYYLIAAKYPDKIFRQKKARRFRLARLAALCYILLT